MADKKQIELIAKVPDEVKGKVVEIIKENPTLKSAMDNMEKGLANPQEVKTVREILSQAGKMLKDSSAKPPKIVTDAQGNVEVKDSWWSKKSTGAKAAIIGGVVLLIGGGIYVYKKAKKGK